MVFSTTARTSWSRLASVTAVPSATLTQLTGGDHYIMEERPDEVTAALLELLARPCVVALGAD
jgi:pimeloyl-ACP methyl ester carboxylesterase